MMSTLARFFRNFNSKLIYTDNRVVEKFLKGLFWISLLIYRQQRKRSTTSSQVIIDNFDSDIKMIIDPSRAMGSAIFWTGFHEFREFLFLHRYLKPEMVFIDVGANQGEYSLFAAKRLTNGQVLAFEPLPSIRNTFEENIRINGFTNIKVMPAGLSHRPDNLVIHEVQDSHEGLATFFLGERKSKASFSVPLLTLDSVVEQQHLSRLDFIKIDIEGAELNALRGAQQTLKRFKPVLMLEINDDTYLAAGYRTQDILDLLLPIGYSPFQVERFGRVAPTKKLPAFGNFIFIAK